MWCFTSVFDWARGLVPINLGTWKNPMQVQYRNWEGEKRKSQWESEPWGLQPCRVFCWFEASSHVWSLFYILQWYQHQSYNFLCHFSTLLPSWKELLKYRVLPACCAFKKKLILLHESRGEKSLSFTRCGQLYSTAVAVRIQCLGLHASHNVGTSASFQS